MTPKTASDPAGPETPRLLAEASAADPKMSVSFSADGRTVVFARAFDAPKELVYQAWVDPARLARWWGPKSYSNPVLELDARPGGAYRIVMRSPEGVDHPMRGVYLEVVPNERLVMTDIVDEHPEEWFELLARYRGEAGAKPLSGVLSIDFSESSGKTTVKVAYAAESHVDLQAIMKMGMAAGWAESFAVLEGLLAAR